MEHKGICTTLWLALFGLSIIGGCYGLTVHWSVQSASVLNAIMVLFRWIPAVRFTAIIVLMKFYKLDDMMPQSKADLEERH